MVIVHHLNESRSQHILWLLEELQLPYEIKQYARDPQTRLAPPALKAVHPLGKSPVITDDGKVIAESGAIIDYVIRRHGAERLQPDPSSAAFDDYMRWMHYAEGPPCRRCCSEQRLEARSGRGPAEPADRERNQQPPGIHQRQLGGSRLPAWRSANRR
jgi:glutathione S-transferase